MIGVKRIDHINMRVNDLNESIEFYRKIFGFEMKEDYRSAEEPWAIVGLKGAAYLCMYEHPGKSKPTDGLTINHFGFVLTEFDAALSTLRENGVEVLYDGVIDWPKSRSIYIKDPSGHEIELVEVIGGGLD